MKDLEVGIRRLLHRVEEGRFQGGVCCGPSVSIGPWKRALGGRGPLR